MEKQNRGVSRLAEVIDQRVKKHDEHTWGVLDLDFGTVEPNGTLQTNTFPKKIAREDYTVLRHCRRELQNKEQVRVLVAWVQDEAVIVGILAE